MRFTLVDRGSENTHISNFMKIGPTRASLFHTERRIDIYDEECSRHLQNFGKEPNKIRIQY